MLLTKDIKNLLYFKKQVREFVIIKENIINKSKINKIFSFLLKYIAKCEKVFDFLSVIKDVIALCSRDTYIIPKTGRISNKASLVVLSLLILIGVIGFIGNFSESFSGILLLVALPLVMVVTMMPLILFLCYLFLELAIKKNKKRKLYVKKAKNEMLAKNNSIRNQIFAKFLMEYKENIGFEHLNNRGIKEILFSFIEWNEKNKTNINKNDLLCFDISEFIHTDRDIKYILKHSEMFVENNKEQFLLLADIRHCVQIRTVLKEAIKSINLDDFKDDIVYSYSSVKFYVRKEKYEKYSLLDKELIRVMSVIEREWSIFSKLDKKEKNVETIKKKKI